jgi:hypothetical protein
MSRRCRLIIGRQRHCGCTAQHSISSCAGTGVRLVAVFSAASG